MAVCLNCGEDLHSKYAEKFCDRSCAATYNNKQREIDPAWWDHLRAENNCRTCGVALKNSKHRFCSEACKESKMKSKEKFIRDRKEQATYKTEEIHTVFEQEYGEDNKLISFSQKHFKTLAKARQFFIVRVQAHITICPPETEMPADWMTTGVAYQDKKFSIEIYKDEIIL